MGRKYRTKVPRKRLRKLNRSNAGPVFALIGIIMGILAIAALIVFVALPFLLPKLGIDYRAPFAPEPTPAPTPMPTPTPHPMTGFAPETAQSEIVLSISDEMDYRWYGDPFYHNGEIVFTGGKVVDGRALMTNLFFYNPDTREANELDYKLQYDHFLFPSMNDDWLVFIDGKFDGGGRIMAMRRGRSSGKPRVVKEFYVGQPEIKLYDHYIVWTERTGTRMDKLYICDLETQESATLAMFNNSEYGQSLPSFMNGLIVWADAYGEFSTQSGATSCINYARLTSRIYTYEPGTYVHDPEGNGAYFAWLDSNHAPGAKLYGAKGPSDPVLIDEGVVEFGLGSDFVVYSKAETIYVYVFEDAASYRITPEGEKAQFMGVSGDVAFWMDVTSRERDIMKFAPIPS